MMANHSLVRFYNPRDLAKETLERLFTGRAHMLEQILDDLRRQATSRSRQHWLVQGPRGAGKTHLMSLVYHRAGADESLSQAYIPVWLGEAESYTCYSVGTFLLCVAERFREELHTRGDPSLASFDENLAAINAAGDDPLLVEELTDFLRTESKNRRTILLIIVENFDALLGGFSKHSGDSEVKSLRALLSSHEQRLLFLGTTATSELAALSDPGRPLFGHLRPLKLEPLNEDETVELFRRVADVVNMPENREALSDVKDGGRLRRRVLHRLTGGSPRAIVMAFFVVKGGEGVEAIVQELTALLDVHTAYFEARLAQCAPRERSILTALCLASTTLTIQEIAKRTRLPQRSLSTQVERLVKDGHLAPAEGSSGKGALYEVADGLFSLWYQYRKGRALLEPIVRFLALWYPPEELEAASHSLAKEARDEEIPLLRRDMARKAFAHFEEALRLSATTAIPKQKAQLWKSEAFQNSRDAGDEGQPKESRNVGEGLADRPDSHAGGTGDERDARTSVSDRIPPGKATSAEEMIDASDKVIRQFAERTESSHAERVAVAFLNKGMALDKLGRPDEALAAYEEVVRRFAARSEIGILKRIASALVKKGSLLASTNRAEEAIAAYDEVARRIGERPEASLVQEVARSLVDKGLTLQALDRPQEAIGAFDRVIRRFAGRSEVVLLRQVARAFVNKGCALARLRRPDDEIAVYDDLIRLVAERSEAALLEALARALVNKGIALQNLNRGNEAIAISDEVAHRFAEQTQAALLEQVGLALNNKGTALGKVGRVDEQLAAYDEVIHRLGERPESTLIEQVAMSFVNKGVTLGNCGRLDDALTVFDEVIRRYADRPELALSRPIITARLGKGVTLGRLNRSEEAIAQYDEVIGRLAEKTDADAIEQGARALVGKGVALGRLKRPDEAVAAFDEAIRRCAERDETECSEHIAHALLNKGVALGELNRADEELAAYEEVIERFGGRTETGILEHVAAALVNKAATLGTLNRADDAVSSCDDVIQRFKMRTEPTLLAEVARAIVSKGVSLGKLRRTAEEIAAYDEVLSLFGERTELGILMYVGRALVNKTAALVALSRNDEAISASESVIGRFADSTEPALRDAVARAFLMKGWLLEARDSITQALACFQEVDDRCGVARLEGSGQLIAEARFQSALLLWREGRMKEAERMRSRWIEWLKVFRQQGYEEIGFRQMLRILPMETARDWLGVLSKAGLREELVKLVQLHTFVADVIESSELRHRGGRQARGPSERRQRALARVPPALREAVRELADAIAAERRRLKVSTSPPRKEDT